MVFDFRTFMGALGGNIQPFQGFDTSNIAGEKTAHYRY
jgi:hypothetical protein